LDRDEQHGVIAPALPPGAIGRGQQRVDLGRAENDTVALSKRFSGIASTRAISAACSGW